MAVFPDQLSDWTISDKHGYILEDPLEKLPDYFDEWNRIAADLPNLIRQKQVRHAVGQMPLLDSTRLSGHKEHRLALTQLAYTACAYVWQDGEQGVPEKLPKQVAIPLWNVSKVLDVNPGLNHASFMQSNWKLANKEGPIIAENIQAIVGFDGGAQFDWFIGVTVEVEHCVVPAIKVIPDLYRALQDKDENIMRLHIETMTKSINRCTEVFSKIHERLDPKVLYEVIRPNLFGWGGDGNPMPNGLIYEGVSDVPITSKTGGTGVFLDAFDTLVGVRKEGYTGQFLQNERASYIVGHRQFITTVEKYIPLRDYVIYSSNAALKEALDDLTAALVAFRQYHRDIITKYVHSAAENDNVSKNFGYKFNKTSSTGANGIVPILDSLIADSERAFL